MPAAIRQAAKTWIKEHIPPDKPTIISTNNSDFRKLTNHDHAYYVGEWEKLNGTSPPRRLVTSCMDFVIAYCNGIGVSSYVGTFAPRQYLQKVGKLHTWMDPLTANHAPKFGDICYWPYSTKDDPSRQLACHMGVSLGAKEIEEWVFDTTGGCEVGHVVALYTAEGGQDNIAFNGNTFDKAQSFACVKRKTYLDPGYIPHPLPVYSSSLLLGWIDIALFQNQLDDDDPAGGIPDSQPAADGRATSSLWRNEDGQVVHPDAPPGGGGAGHFRSAGTLFGNPFMQGLPHPYAPAVRNLDRPEIRSV